MRTSPQYPVLDAHHLTQSANLWSCRLKAELNCNDCYTATVGGGGWSSLPPSKESQNALCRAVELSSEMNFLGLRKEIFLPSPRLKL